jgi:hypothetical protein
MVQSVSIHVKCPLCKMSLMDNEHPIHNKPSIKLNIQHGKGRGTIRLCSIYDCYDHECDVDLSLIDIAEFSCPHCNQVLNSTEKCDTCGAPMVPFVMDISGKVAICSRNGCTKHYVAFENPLDAVSKFYDEYGF